jgi:uncharacterized protein (TIGR03083 family)
MTLDYLAHLRADGEALVRAAEEQWDAAVPSCPGWTAGDVVAHTGEVHRHKIAVVRAGGTERPDVAPITPPPAAEVRGWYREGLAELLHVLSVDPERVTYSWAGDHRVAFWRRRMAHETLIHRWDAEAAIGDAAALDAELAADGVQEVLDIWLPRDDEPSFAVRLEATDVDRTWTVGAGDAVVTARGSAGALDLLLWRRLGLDAVEVEGDGDALEAFLAWPDLS